jgi:flagellar protein FlbD
MRKVVGVILVTRLNGSQFYVNAELIQMVESTPDTVLSFAGGEKFIVHESAEDVIQRIIEYRRKVFSGMPFRSAGQPKDGE